MKNNEYQINPYSTIDGLLKNHVAHDRGIQSLSLAIRGIQNLINLGCPIDQNNAWIKSSKQDTFSHELRATRSKDIFLQNFSNNVVRWVGRSFL